CSQNAQNIDISEGMLCLSSLILSYLFVLSDAFEGIVAVQQVLEKHRILSEIRENQIDHFSFLTEETSISFSPRQLLSIISQFNAVSDLSHDCDQDLKLIRDALLHPTSHLDFIKKALAQMLDSNGKIGPAILKGHYFFSGHYSECREVDYKVEGRDRHFRGEYFRFDIDPYLRSNSRNDSCLVNSPEMPLGVYWEVGVCFP
ncbi:hypothetical protein PMAYCL1PPCAC_14770, partial [Pristionchus mayeri]